MIQEAINQALGTVGIAARLSPEYETKQELHQAKKQEKALTMQQDALPQITPEEFEAQKTVAAKQHKQAEQKLADVKQKIFELNPSKQTMREAHLAQSSAYNIPLMTFQENANSKAKQVSQAKRSQRRNFMEYLRKEPISGGGTIGDLPPHVQKSLAKQYTKSQRKQLMDREDNK